MSLFLTQNGNPTASVVLSPMACELEQYAAEELVTHVKKVSGAELPIVNDPSADVSANVSAGISIVIGTPDSIPALANLFPEDIAWLRTTWDNGKRYGSDGFAIRTAETTIYIFGATPRGAINGVYDFLEKNLGILWLRAEEDLGLVYEAMPSIDTVKVNYREKSPFEIRGWHVCLKDKEYHTERVLMRNKLNTITSPHGIPDRDVDIGMNRLLVSHNTHALVKESPLYDPEITEYRNTDDDGNPLSWEESDQVNFFSDLVVKAIAASVIQRIRKTGVPSVFVGNEDHRLPGRMVPHDTLPFEYAPGKFVTPDCENYYSTVFYTFLNRVSRLVTAEIPNAILQTFAYKFSRIPPECAIEKNIHVVIAAIDDEDLTTSLDDPTSEYNVRYLQLLEAWKKCTPNLIVYNYYGCYRVSGRFERAIWHKMKGDLQYYAKGGFSGVCPEGVGDCRGFVNIFMKDDPEGSHGIWGMNALTFWLFGKLSWNPDEDVNGLIDLFCRKYYGGAWKPMRKYYDLLLQGWTEGRNDTIRWDWNVNDLSLYMENFIEKPGLREPILETIQQAWDAANDVEKARIRRIKEVYESYFGT